MCHRSGAAVWEAFLLPGGDITIDSGERAAFDSGLGVTRYRCAGKCGQPLYGEWGVGTDKHMAALSASFFVGGDAANEVGPICGRGLTPLKLPPCRPIPLAQTPRALKHLTNVEVPSCIAVAGVLRPADY